MKFYITSYRYYKNIIVLVWPGAAHAPMAL